MNKLQELQEERDLAKTETEKIKAQENIDKYFFGDEKKKEKKKRKPKRKSFIDDEWEDYEYEYDY